MEFLWGNLREIDRFEDLSLGGMIIHGIAMDLKEMGGEVVEWIYLA
jgi:hypothetical protein